MAGRYRYLLVDASTGLALGELPLTVASFTYQLNGVGQLTGTIPRDHPMAQDIYWALYLSTNSDREITVLRDDVPVWNGPTTILAASERDATQMQVTAREASWYLTKRTLEVDKNYVGWDLFSVARDVVGTYMITKTSTAGDGTASPGLSINATLPRWIVSPALGASGFTLPSTNVPSYYGAARHLISEIMDGLVADPTSGLDYKMAYTGDRVRCQREFTVGAPLGAVLAPTLTEHVVYDFTKTEDRERAANRVHTLAGTPVTLQNTGSIANGDLLIESVFSPPQQTDSATVTAYTRDARRRAQPPVAVYTGTFVPGAALPFGWCSVGDRVNLGIGGSTILHSEGHVRITEIDVVPPQGGSPELVTLTFGVPLDALGT